MNGQTKKLAFCCPHHGFLQSSVEYFSAKVGSKFLVDLPIMYCEKCNRYYTPFSNILTLFKLKYKGKLILPSKGIVQKNVDRIEVRIPYFSDTKTETVNETTKQTSTKPVPVAENHHVITPINSVNTGSTKKIIYVTTFLKRCIICQGSMTDYVNFIPVNDTGCVTIKGKYCSRCNKFFYKDISQLEKILKNNTYATTYTINTDYHISARVRNQFQNLKSIAYTYYLKNLKNGTSAKVVIVSDKAEEAITEGVYHYTNEVARTLLAYTYHLKEKEIMLNEDCYRIILAVPKKQDYTAGHILQEIKISKSGGLYSNSSNHEIVDVLLYSPYTKRYEIIKATYDKEWWDYYIDISIFKRFVRQYGNPGIPITFYVNGSPIGFDGLKDESVLHSFGYTVSQEANLSDSKRQQIIADVLDLGLMKTKEIVMLLEFLINSHKSYKYQLARLKWERDIRFTMGYKINPDRFVIAKT